MGDIRRYWGTDHAPGRGTLTVISQPAPPSAAFYFEVTITSADCGGHACAGVANASFNLEKAQALDYSAGPYASLIGGTFIGWCPAGANSWGGTPSGGPNGPGGAGATGDVWGFAVDVANRLLWWRNVTLSDTTWYGSGVSSPDPATGVDGWSLAGSGIGSSDDLYVLAGGNNEGVTDPTVTVNFGHTSFASAAPSGFSAWDSTTTSVLNSADKATEVALSGGNLVATVALVSGANGPTAFVRSTTHK
ncbi:MAG: hypothetical protein ACRDRB_09775 [Pseudonocardiaceae bacterium]